MAGHLIDRESRRCVDVQARDETGSQTAPHLESARCWCVAGSLGAAGVALGYLATEEAERERARPRWERLLKIAAEVADAAGPEDLIWVWNSGTETHRDMIAKALREAT